MINISVDGGGTKINVLAFDENLTLLGYGTGGGINIRFESIERVYEHIKGAICDCMKNIDDMHINKVYCTMVSDSQPFKDILKSLGYTFDSFTRLPEGYTYLLAGGLTDKGYVALSGTGSGAVYCNGINNILHLGGYGTPVGDDGSGAWIGIKGINAVTRYLAGWGVQTSLKDRLFEYLDITDKPHSFLSALYPTDKSTRSLYAKFAKIVGQEADLGDIVAFNIVKEAGILMGEQLVGVTKTQYGENAIFDDLQINVFCCGGAWKCSQHMFNAFTAHVKSVIPHAQCYLGKFDPVVGGVIQFMLDNKLSIESYRSHLFNEFKMFSMR